MNRALPWLALTATTALSGALAFTFHQAPAVAADPVTHAEAKTRGACTDHDGDGYGLGCAKGPDCNDRDASVHPGQAEICDFRDNDCSGQVDDAPSCPTVIHDSSPVSVPAGTFAMGSPDGVGAADEHPRHTVTTKAFVLDRYEVTNARYRACVDAGACSVPALLSSNHREDYFRNAAFDAYPVVHVSHAQATAFCQADGGRLPTEAEWEMAARGAGSDVRTFPWGNESADCSKANMGGKTSCVGDTDIVGRRAAGKSPTGAFDMAGNVWEWTADYYDAAYYQNSPSADPRGPAAGSLRVMRGGCWVSGEDSLRVSCRKPALPSTWASNVGFRCARDGK
jgi:formylglycine-generating enzyme required for sulfatase activity